MILPDREVWASGDRTIRFANYVSPSPSQRTGIFEIKAGIDQYELPLPGGADARLRVGTTFTTLRVVQPSCPRGDQYICPPALSISLVSRRKVSTRKRVVLFNKTAVMDCGSINGQADKL